MASEIQCRACANFNKREHCSRCIDMDHFKAKAQPHGVKTEYKPVQHSRIPAGNQGK